jgi:hypothetical protein
MEVDMTFTFGSLALAALTTIGEGENRPPAPTKPFVAVDLSPLANVPGPDDTTIGLELEAANGAKFRNYIVFGAHGDETPNLIFLSFEPLLQKPFLDRKDSWDYQRIGNRIFIKGWRGANGETSQITKIRVTSKGTFALEHVPTIIAPEGVVVQRDVNRSANKK